MALVTAWRRATSRMPRWRQHPGLRTRASSPGCGCAARGLPEPGREDAAGVYEAILRATPAGLGTAEREDVSAPPAATLREAMALAAGRDRIARAYVTAFEA